MRDFIAAFVCYLRFTPSHFAADTLIFVTLLMPSPRCLHMGFDIAWRYER